MPPAEKDQDGFGETTDDTPAANGLSAAEQRQMIQDLRRRVEESPTYSKLAPHDAQRLVSENYDWWLRAFLDRYDWDLDVTAPCFIEALKWRKDAGVNDISVLRLKKTFEAQTLFIRGRDRQGMWFRVRHHDKSAPTKDKQDAMAFWMEKHYFESRGAEMVIIFDLYQAGLGQTDLDGVRFLLNMLKYYYPGCLSYLLVYEIPWVLNAAWKVIKSWLDAEAQKKIMFIGKKDIAKHIAPDHLPLHCGGTDNYTFQLEHLSSSSPRPQSQDSTDWQPLTPSTPGDEDEPRELDQYHSMPMANGHVKSAYEWTTDHAPIPKKRSVKFEDDENEVGVDAFQQQQQAATSDSATVNAHSNAGGGPPAPPPKPKAPAPPPNNADPTTTASGTQLTSALKNGAMGESVTSSAEPITVQHKLVPVRTPKNFTGRVRELMDWRVATFAQNAHQAAFVAVSPRDELTFHAVPGEQDRIDFILLKNTADRPIVYKIKTTSPEKFRVRPSSGYLAANDRVIVRIFLQAGYQETASKEKFLVAAFQTSMTPEQFSPEKISEIWKQAPKDQIFEYRLMCRVSDVYNAVTSPATSDSAHPTSAGNAAVSSAQLDEVVERMRGENRVLIAVTLTVLALLTLLLLYQRSIYHSLANRLDSLQAKQCT